MGTLLYYVINCLSSPVGGTVIFRTILELINYVKPLLTIQMWWLIIIEL